MDRGRTGRRRRSGSTNGPSYTQLRLGPDGPQVIEVAARLGGGHDAELVEAVTGVDLNGLAIDAALGTDPSCRVGTSRGSPGAVTRFLVAPSEGVLPRSVEVPDELEGVSGCASIASPGTGSRHFAVAPIARAPSWPSAPRASRRSRGRTRRPSAYASTTADDGDSASRETFLSFQPPAIGEDEIEAVTQTLRSGWLTTGPRAAELEARMREYLEAEHVLAVSSCTAALHLSLAALGVGPGDEVITTSITWPATANVVVHCGATRCSPTSAPTR